MFQAPRGSRGPCLKQSEGRGLPGQAPPKTPGDLLGANHPGSRSLALLSTQARAHPGHIPWLCPEGGAAHPASAYGRPRGGAAAGAPRPVSRERWGPAPGRGRPGPRRPAPSAHPEAAAARRAPRECPARRASGRRREAGARVAAGGSRRPCAPGSPRGAWGASSRDRARAPRPAPRYREAAPGRSRTPTCREDDHGRGQEGTGGPAKHVSGEYCPAVQR